MSASIELLENRRLFAATATLVQLRSDDSTFKTELLADSKGLAAEVKTLVTDYKHAKAISSDTKLLNASLKASVTLPIAQLVKSLGVLNTKAAAYSTADNFYLAHPDSIAADVRVTKASDALTTADDTEMSLASTLASTRLVSLVSTATESSTSIGDPTTSADTVGLSNAASADSGAITSQQTTVQTDVDAVFGDETL